MSGNVSIFQVCDRNEITGLEVISADVVLLVLYFREMRHIRSAQTGLLPEASPPTVHRKLSSAHAYR
jgi:hypothetical protein